MLQAGRDAISTLMSCLRAMSVIARTLSCVICARHRPGVAGDIIGAAP